MSEADSRSPWVVLNGLNGSVDGSLVLWRGRAECCSGVVISRKAGRRVWARTRASPVQCRVGGEVGDDCKWRKPLSSTLAKATGFF